MFEGSLVESRGLVVSRAQRWSAAGSAALQLTLAALIVTIPMLRPQVIQYLTQTPHLSAPPLPVRPPEIVRVNRSNASSSGPAARSTPTQAFSGSRIFSPEPDIPTDDGSPGPIGPIIMGGGTNRMPALGSGSRTEVTVAHARPDRPVNLSGGVSQGMLLAPIRAAYPQIAIVTKTQGTVVVEAVISKAGKIESAQAISGPPMLRQAALDAVTAARYRPYLLSGEPIEVQTTVTVVFRLGE